MMRNKKLVALLALAPLAAAAQNLALSHKLTLAQATTAAAPASAPAAAPVPIARPLTLGEAYRLATQNDANLAATRAATDARRERIPQARAQLLPNIQANVTRYKNDLDSTTPHPITGAPVHSNRDYFSSSQMLTLRQPVFRAALFADYKQAKAQVEEAEAQLDREVQNLAVRVSTAYMQALLAQDQLQLVRVQKGAYTTQLAAARRALAAGSGTRTDIDDAQARVDMATAQELEAQQNVDFTRRNLGALLDQPVTAIAGVDEARLPLVPPVPSDLQSWVMRAEDASPELRAIKAQREAARQEVAKARAGHLPTLDAVAQWSKSVSDSVTAVNTTYENRQIGVQLNVPIFAGGMVQSQVRQALAELQRVESALEATRRDFGLRVEKEFRGVTEGVLRVRALEQAVRSADTAADSARQSFRAGARTQLDVLTAEEARVQALRNLAEARYVYLLSRIRLMSLAGEADQSAIDQVDAWLKR
jgi:outer membrane protein, protease secretion system